MNKRQQEYYPEYVADLKALDHTERADLPMSLGPSGQVLSKYSDHVWDFWPYIHKNNSSRSDKKINFQFKFSDWTYFTDPVHVKLLESSRTFLYARLKHKHPKSGLVQSYSSIVTLFERLRVLLAWMVENNYKSFTDLTSKTCLAYVQHSKGLKLSTARLFLRFLCLEEIYLFRKHIENAPSTYPWPGETSFTLSGRKKSSKPGDQGTTEAIPDRLCQKLAKGSILYIDSGLSDLLLDCRDLYESHIADSWQERRDAITPYLEQLGFENFNTVKREIYIMYTACYAVICLFSGLRNSEMISLKCGCYTEDEGWDGAIYGWINGITYKLEKEPKPSKWMVPPIVQRAIQLAERISKPIRSKLATEISKVEKRLRLAENANLQYISSEEQNTDIDRLHRLKDRYDLLFLTQAHVPTIANAWTNLTTNVRMKELAKHLDLRVKYEDLDQIKGKDRIKADDIWPLASHQFRKAFAVYVARNSLGDVLYLRKHFKHWSLDMTLYYAANDFDSIDETLFNDVLTERGELQTIIIEGWINSQTPLAGAGSLTIKEFRNREEVRVAKNHRELARKLSTGFFIRGTGHSWCTAENCKGLGIYNVLECKDCENRIIDKSHQMVWHGIRNQQIELLKMDDLSDPMWQRAKDHLRYAEQIIQELGDDMEPYPVPPMPSEHQKIQGI